MRVISGKYKGRVLKGFDIDGTRPTMERVKESLFAMIQNNIKDKIVLDLFSGSGNLGIEALSQGAKYTYLVDYNKIATKTIKENLNNLKITNALVIEKDYLLALSFFKQNNIKLDIVFLDPPYKSKFINKAIEYIEKEDLLNEDGLIVCETDCEEIICKYSLIKTRRYGSKIVSIYKK